MDDNKEPIPSIEDIDKGLSEIFGDLKNRIETLEFRDIFEGTVNEFEENFSSNNDFDVKGVYRIEIKNNGKFKSYRDWVKYYQELWEEEERKFDIQSTPNFVSHRIKAHESLSEWMPLYIGKSTNIADRVRDHFLKKGNTDTYAMKLKARKEFSKETFKISIVKLDVKHYETIVSIAEDLFSDEVNPLIGKHQKFNIVIDSKE